MVRSRLGDRNIVGILHLMEETETAAADLVFYQSINLTPARIERELHISSTLPIGRIQSLVGLPVLAPTK
jgi:hypothetical protein